MFPKKGLPGQRYDAASGLNYNYFRDYEPGTGRYVESDPKGLFGDIATYSYVANKPMIYVDPDGQEPVQGCGGGYGVTICDGKGGYTSRVCNKECTAQCTQAHENKHIADYYGRAPDRCRGKKYGDNPGRYSDIDDLSFYRDECRALRIGKKCAEKMLNDNNTCLSPQCNEAATRYIRGIDYYLGRYRCDAYGW